jgi:hypothetical protein
MGNQFCHDLCFCFEDDKHPNEKRRASSSGSGTGHPLNNPIENDEIGPDEIENVLRSSSDNANSPHTRGEQGSLAIDLSRVSSDEYDGQQHQPEQQQKKKKKSPARLPPSSSSSITKPQQQRRDSEEPLVPSSSSSVSPPRGTSAAPTGSSSSPNLPQTRRPFNPSNAAVPPQKPIRRGSGSKEQLQQEPLMKALTPDESDLNPDLDNSRDDIELSLTSSSDANIGREKEGDEVAAVIDPELRESYDSLDGRSPNGSFSRNSPRRMAGNRRSNSKDSEEGRGSGGGADDDKVQYFSQKSIKSTVSVITTLTLS